MLRTLVISDIHNRIATAQRLIDTVPHDKAIFLGDYFDSFGDGYIDANNTAVWLRDVALKDHRNVFLLGNHDAQYFWPHHYDLACSGYTDSKRDAIQKELNFENTNNFERFKFYYMDQGYFFAHAGLDNRIWKQLKQFFEQKEGQTKLQFVDEVLTYWVEKAKHQIAANQKVELLGAGWDRGGRQQVGGLNWVDFSSLAPVQGINQIVGHTPHPVPDVKIQKQGGAISVRTIFEFYDHASFNPSKNPLSVNYALDTHSKHYMVIEDGEIQVWDAIHNIKVQDLQQYAIPESPMSGLPGLLPSGSWEEIKPKI